MKDSRAEPRGPVANTITPEEAAVRLQTIADLRRRAQRMRKVAERAAFEARLIDEALVGEKAAVLLASCDAA